MTNSDNIGNKSEKEEVVYFDLEKFKNGELTPTQQKYLGRLWQWFQIHQIEPLPEQSDTDEVRIMQHNGRNIHVHTGFLATSIGENPTTFSTQQTLNTVEEMVEMMKKRGVTEVAFVGLEDACLYAAMRCKEAKIHVVNFEPDPEQVAVIENSIKYLDNIEKQRHQLQDSAGPGKVGKA